MMQHVWQSSFSDANAQLLTYERKIVNMASIIIDMLIFFCGQQSSHNHATLLSSSLLLLSLVVNCILIYSMSSESVGLSHYVSTCTELYGPHFHLFELSFPLWLNHLNQGLLSDAQWQL